MLHYIDPSAWVKRHFHEEGSEAVNSLFRGSIHAACCRLGLVEMVATIARKSAQESISPTVTQALLDNVHADFGAFRVIAMDEGRIAAATALALLHRLRTMDALHLACALSLRSEDAVTLVSADLELLAAADREGLATLNPAVPSHP